MRKHAITLHYGTDKYLLFFFNFALYFSDKLRREENSAKSMYGGVNCIDHMSTFAV